MRKITFGGASSLDARFARPDHSVDWLMPSEDGAQIMHAFWKTIDTVLMGRKTYEIAARSPRGAGTPGIATYVFSRMLDAIGDNHVTLVKQDAVAFVRALKSQSGKGIFLMGGGALAAAMLEAGLVDEIAMSVHPVLLGAGIAAFGALGRQVDLELMRCQAFKNGCVYVTYTVKNAA